MARIGLGLLLLGFCLGLGLGLESGFCLGLG